MLISEIIQCVIISATTTFIIGACKAWSKSTSFYKSIAAAGADRLLVIGTAEKTLLTAGNDIYAILAHRGQDSVRQIALNTYTFKNTMKYVTDAEVDVHLACHGHADGRIQFDDQAVSAWGFIKLLDNQVVDTLLLMACHGEKFAALVTGQYVKNVVCVSFDHEVPDEIATEIASEFWRCMKENQGDAEIAFNETRKNISLENANKLHLFTSEK